ncbi:MAG TPA: DinB family protein [Vicinamibacterales bacterium]|jgi:uncharacterized damage-inducible protein DinB
MTDAALPEVWLRGPVPEVPAELMPAAHALLQIAEELDRLVTTLSFSEVWDRPGGAASIGFHLRHLAGSLDRLLTYARGEALSESQMAAMQAESQPAGSGEDASVLLRAAHEAIDRALAQMRATRPSTLLEPRVVGRGRLPSTVLGLLFHAAEHAQRHAGQIATTARILQGRSS